MPQKTYKIIHTTEYDDDICIVPLKNSKKTVKLLESDYDDLVSNFGITGPYSLYLGQVMAPSNSKQRYVSVARLICDADGGERVIYLDGNFNLKRGVLSLGKGGNSKGRAREVYKPSQRLYRQPIVEHIYEASPRSGGAAYE